MFPVVLVVNDRLNAFKPGRECALLSDSLGAAAIGIATPRDISLRKIFIRLPAFFIDQGLQPCTIGARFRAEDAKSGFPPGFFQ